MVYRPPPPRQKIARTRMEKYMTGLVTKNYRVPWTRAFFCPVVCQAMKENYIIWKICLDGNTAENSYCKSVKICTFLSTKLNGSHFGDNSLDSFGNIPSALLKGRERNIKRILFTSLLSSVVSTCFLYYYLSGLENLVS